MKPWKCITKRYWEAMPYDMTFSCGDIVSKENILDKLVVDVIEPVQRRCNCGAGNDSPIFMHPCRCSLLKNYVGHHQLITLKTFDDNIVNNGIAVSGALLKKVE